MTKAVTSRWQTVVYLRCHFCHKNQPYAKVEAKVAVARHPWCPHQDSPSLHEALQHARLHKAHPQGPGAYWHLVPSMLGACAGRTTVPQVANNALGLEQ
jgi:hypothetical protein